VDEGRGREARTLAVLPLILRTTFTFAHSLTLDDGFIGELS
jgi:hypothetical protein